MKIMLSTKKQGGFSLVELLTVIAIIAILAAIIFPVMTSVRQNANESTCITQMKQMASAVKMYKTDNKRFPEVLGAKVTYDSEGNPLPFDQIRKANGGLYPNQVNSYSVYRCPNSTITKTNIYVQYYSNPNDTSSSVIESYAYSSYDCAIRDGATPVSGVYQPADVEARYCRRWVPETGSKSSDIDWIENSSGLSPWPPGTTDTPALAQMDYERQLSWRNPPDTTVISWCSRHTPHGGKVIVVFLDGSMDKVMAGDMDQCKWRVKPSLE